MRHMYYRGPLPQPWAELEAAIRRRSTVDNDGNVIVPDGSTVPAKNTSGTTGSQPDQTSKSLAKKQSKATKKKKVSGEGAEEEGFDDAEEEAEDEAPDTISDPNALDKQPVTAKKSKKPKPLNVQNNGGRIVGEIALVTRGSSRYVATCFKRGKRINLGTYSSRRDAAQAVGAARLNYR
jgi:hypothetical protein